MSEIRVVVQRPGAISTEVGTPPTVNAEMAQLLQRIQWGQIQGTLSNQTDLQSALNALNTTPISNAEIDAIVRT